MCQGFSHFSCFLHHFVMAKLATISIRVNYIFQLLEVTLHTSYIYGPFQDHRPQIIIYFSISISQLLSPLAFSILVNAGLYRKPHISTTSHAMLSSHARGCVMWTCIEKHSFHNQHASHIYPIPTTDL